MFQGNLSVTVYLALAIKNQQLNFRCKSSCLDAFFGHQDCSIQVCDRDQVKKLGTLKAQKKEVGSMSSSLGVMSNLGILIPAIESRTAKYSEIYSENCHRVYSLAFWMTDNELVAEELASNTFLRAFASSSSPNTDQIDRAFLAEVSEFTPIGMLSLNASVSADTKNIYGNVKRVHLERAVVQLPATEKLVFLLHDVEGYEHKKIAQLLGISVQESQLGLHQARVQVRELVSRM
jgi:RNA polymerase sigma-70 factor (ECF subfamily)